MYRQNIVSTKAMNPLFPVVNKSSLFPVCNNNETASNTSSDGKHFFRIFLKIDTANVLTEAQIKLMLFMSLTAVIDALGPMDINLVIVRSVRVLN